MKKSVTFYAAVSMDDVRSFVASHPKRNTINNTETNQGPSEKPYKFETHECEYSVFPGNGFLILLERNKATGYEQLLYSLIGFLRSCGIPDTWIKSDQGLDMLESFKRPDGSSALKQIEIEDTGYTLKKILV